MEDQFLIITADERSWKFDRPVLFLGEWCRRYDRRDIWEKMDAEVAEPYGLRAGQKERDLAFVQRLIVQLLDELVEILNAIHHTSHSARYWHILLGNWLQKYVAILFNRYYTLENTFKKYQISGSILFDSPSYHLSTPDSRTFIDACDDDIWNHVLYSKILKFFGQVNLEVDSKPLHGVTGFGQKSNLVHPQKRSTKHLLQKITRSFLSKFFRKDDAFIINSYLPRMEEVKLQALLRQCPQMWESLPLESVELDMNRRQIFGEKAVHHTGFDKFIRSQLSEMIPLCYIEGYELLLQQVESLPWPSTPRFIFTSNNYSTDEVFKAWVGSKVEKGVPYYIGQHGNLYGTEMGSQYYPETITCDKFITWGWSYDNSRYIPAFVFTTAGRQQQEVKSNGGLLLIEVHPPHLLTPWDSYYEYIAYQEEQFRFSEALPKTIKEKLTVRFHPEYNKHMWSPEKRWRDRGLRVHIENGSVKLRKLIRQSRLVVHSYDSTGILETLALNIPTLCFWQGGLDHLLPQAKPYYELLKEAGIFSSSPEKAAETIALHWNGIGEWWSSRRIQNAREEFCRQYARSEKKPIRALKKIFLQQTNEMVWKKRSAIALSCQTK